MSHNKIIYNDPRDLTTPQSGTVEVVVEEDISRIALCTLSAVNLGNIRSMDDIEKTMRAIVRGLDRLLDYQDYMHPAAYEATLDYRPLGIGIINLAYFFAKNNVRYADHEAHKLIHEVMEAIQFYGLKASMELAKEKGPCRKFSMTKYADGLLPIDWYNKAVDEIVEPVYNMDWEWLRKQIKKHGLRNSTITAMMPSESSSKINNATNGIEPVLSLIVTKGNKESQSKFVVPEIRRLKNRYDFAWEMQSNEGIIKTVAVIGKFTCQAISTNLYYNLERFEDNKVPTSVMMRDVLLCAKYGIKTLYYHNTNDDRDTDVQNISMDMTEVESVVGPVVEDDDQDCCKI